MKVNFNVVPNGIIKGGTACYDVNPSTGVINYQASVVAKVLFFTKTENFNGQYVVDPCLVKSSQISMSGYSVKINNVQLNVTKVSGNSSQVAMRILDKNISGVVICDTSDPDCFEIEHAIMDGVVSGLKIHLELERV